MQHLSKLTQDIQKAAEIIKSGGVVAFPTETVYGLGADATNEKAVQKIFMLKNRPCINPLIVHVKSMSHAKDIAIFNDDATILAKNFWPGALTLVLPLKEHNIIAKSVLAGLNSIAVRSPSNLIAHDLINCSDTAIAAPSANPSGYVSASTYEHVYEHFHNTDVFILRDLLVNPEIKTHDCLYGIESTIIDLTSYDPTILRYGFITPEIISEVLEKEVKISSSLTAIKAPGMMLKHYSPETKLRLNAVNLDHNEIGLNFGDSKLISTFNLNLSISGDLAIAASNLYYMLRVLDNYAKQHKISQIAVAPIPNISIGLAINDRLMRASN